LCDRSAHIFWWGLSEQTGLSQAVAVRPLRRGFNSSPEVIRLTVMMYARYLPSLRKVEDLRAWNLRQLPLAKHP
jgi:hypothetical protein